MIRTNIPRHPRTLSPLVDSLESRLVLTGLPTNPASTYVIGLYTSVLQRQPSSAEVQSWDDAIASQKLSNQTVAQIFWNAPEHRVLEVTVDYQTLLHRAPDPAGLAFFTSQLESGKMNEAEVQEKILDSTEYVNANPDPTSFVTSLYENVLKRAPSATEVSRWVRKIGSGLTEAQVANDFLNSPEAQADGVAADSPNDADHAAETTEIPGTLDNSSGTDNSPDLIGTSTDKSKS